MLQIRLLARCLIQLSLAVRQHAALARHQRAQCRQQPTQGLQLYDHWLAVYVSSILIGRQCNKYDYWSDVLQSSDWLSM